MARYVIGADENGMGPRLGPLVVTAVLARVEEEACPILTRKPRGGLRKRLGDSKGLVAHGDVSLAEAWARALVERGAGSADAGGPDELLRAISLDGREVLTEPCPRHVEVQCWSDEGEQFVDNEWLTPVRGDLRRLAKRGVEVVAVRTVVVCTKRLNEAVAEGKSRFVVDLHAMERLILQLHQIAGAEVTAVCGKVGGYNRYGKAFGPLGGRLHVALEEGRACSTYQFPGLGELSFVRDGDDSHILVGLASLVGKWVRELLMGRINRHYQRRDPSLESVSGYYDPTTTRFVVATEDLRRRLRVPASCFEREKVGR